VFESLRLLGVTVDFIFSFRVSRRDSCSSTNSAMRLTAKLLLPWRSSVRRTKAPQRQGLPWTRNLRWGPHWSASVIPASRKSVLWYLLAVHCDTSVVSSADLAFFSSLFLSSYDSLSYFPSLYICIFLLSLSFSSFLISFLFIYLFHYPFIRYTMVPDKGRTRLIISALLLRSKEGCRMYRRGVSCMSNK
jgi:hypothetical protein